MHLEAASCLLGVNTHHARGKRPITSENRRLLRTLSLLTRHYIHVCKCAEEIKSFRNLLKYIKDIYNTEERIAGKKGTLHLLNNKWGQTANLLKDPAIINN